MLNEKGQSLIELIVSITIAILVLSSLAFAIITSLRNASLANSQAQATKLAQEGLEKVRSIRDRDGATDYIKADGTHTGKFSELWSISFTCSGENCVPANGGFILDNSSLKGVSITTFEIIDPKFKRQIQIKDYSANSKQVTAVVKWDDATGAHESKLTTILRNINL